jgi:hypothetical protein
MGEHPSQDRRSARPPGLGRAPGDARRRRPEPPRLRAPGPEDLSLHFHVLLLGGRYVADADGAPRFRRAHRWRQAHVDALIVRVAARCEAWLARRGFGTDVGRDDDEPDDALPSLQSASVPVRSTVRQRKARRVQRLGGELGLG